MNEFVTLSELRAALEREGLKYAVLPLLNGHRLLVTERWGRIFGPYLSDNDRGTLWTSGMVLDETLFADMIRRGDWCVGGDRIWLAPEVQYNIADRFSFEGEGGYSLPAQIDPGNYTLSVSDSGRIELAQEMELTLHNTASGRKHLHLKRIVKPSIDPLKHIEKYNKINEHVLFTGYSQEVELTDLSPDGALTEVWNIIQLYPGGTVAAPTAGRAEYQDYYEPVEQQFLKVKEGAVFVKLTGRHKFKVGFKSAGVFCRIGYFEGSGKGNARLVVRSFHNNPSFPYVDEPIGKPGKTGDSVQFYNDDGSLGGFGEIEVHGAAVGGKNETGHSRDLFELWQYTGDNILIGEIAYMLLGIRAPEL